MSWWEYVERWKGADTQDAAADAIGVTPSTVSRWRAGGADPKHVAAFARHYKRPVLEAFLAAGFLTPEEAEQLPAAEPDLEHLTNDEVLGLVRARMREEGEADRASQLAAINEGIRRRTEAGGVPADTTSVKRRGG